MIDIVYTLGNESKWDDNELRYSLRSLEKNFKILGKIYLVGHKPNWVQNIIHIQAGDPYLANKDANLISKIILACNNKELSDEFLFFSDDQIYLKEIYYEDVKTPIIDNSYLINDTTKRLNRWNLRLKRTIDKLKEQNLTWDCFEAHIPYLINKELYPKIMLNYNYGEDIGYCVNTIYFNAINSIRRENHSNEIIRINAEFNSIEVIESLCKDKTYLNYADKAINKDFKLYLQQKFPVKSKYEI